MKAGMFVASASYWPASRPAQWWLARIPRQGSPAPGTQKQQPHTSTTGRAGGRSGTGSARDHGTFCVSCHTALPYALSRPALRVALAEQGPSINERRLIEDVTERVRLWKDVGPYYSDQGYDHKTAESRGTESVLNALILAGHDAQSGQLSDDTRAAFDNMWALQQTTGENAGSWLWLQFDQEPWEGNDSAYYGAALAAIAVGTAPGSMRRAPESRLI